MGQYKLITFCEFGDDRDAPSVRSSIGGLVEPLVEPVASYLRSGVSALSFDGVVGDVIDRDNSEVSSDSFVTDGEWAWREDVEYYVCTYRVKLPDDFVAKAIRAERVNADAVDLEDFEAWSLDMESKRLPRR